MIFTKYKKAAAMILALVLILHPACAQHQAFAFDAPVELCSFNLENIDWTELLSHFSAFSGLFYWISSAISEMVASVKEMGIWDFLSLLLQSGIIPELFDSMESEPPGAFSI